MAVDRLLFIINMIVGNDYADDVPMVFMLIRNTSREMLDYVFRIEDERKNLNFKLEGYSLIHLLVRHGMRATVQVMIEKKVNLNYGISSVKFRVYRPLEYAIMFSDFKMIRLLLANGADPFECMYYSLFYNARQPKMEQVILDFVLNTGKTYAHQRTAFHFAAFSEGTHRIIEHFLSISDDFDVDDNVGQTALHLLSKRQQRESTLAVLKKKLFYFQNSDWDGYSHRSGDFS